MHADFLSVGQLQVLQAYSLAGAKAYRLRLL